MSQKLILPLGGAVRVNAAYKVAAYQKEWGFPHYGIDLGCDDRTVRAIGNGKVIAAGLDGANTSQRFGYAVVIVYPDVEVRCAQKTASGESVKAGQAVDLACRMFHFASLAVKAGQEIKPGDVIGVYGATGKYVSGPHLHLEFDLDADAPQYAYGIKTSGNIIKAGSADSTIDPSLVWYLGEGQSITAANKAWLQQGWILPNDLDIPALPQEADWRARALAAEEKLEKIRAVLG